MTDLPTQYGSVIGWAKFYKGVMHFYAAILSRGIDEDPLMWFVSGDPEPYNPQELLEAYGTEWVDVGDIEIDPDVLDLVVRIDREQNGE